MYAQDISGTGAALFGGRLNKRALEHFIPLRVVRLLYWNLPSMPRLLSFLNSPLLKLKSRIPLTSLDMSALPDNWREYPAPSALSMIGETWVRENKSIALKIPSSVEPNSYNYILNCTHPEYEKVKITDIEPFHIDIRLLRK